MKIKVLYFGMIAEVLGKKEEEILFENSKELIDLPVYFNTRYEKLKGMKFTIAVNQEIKEKVIIDNSVNEIAILPPFAGG